MITEGENRTLSTEVKPEAEDMRALLEDAEIPSIRRGEIVRGVVMRLGQEGILVSIGHKSEGIVPPGEMQSIRKEDWALVNVGDDILARVLITEDDDGSCILSIDQAREEVAWETLKEKLQSQRILRSRVPCLAGKNFIVACGYLPIFSIIESIFAVKSLPATVEVILPSRPIDKAIFLNLPL